MTRDMINEILEDVGLESIYEETDQPVRTRTLAEVIKHIIIKAS